MKTIREAKILYIVCAALTIAAGIFLIVKPDISLTLLCTVAGALMIFFGACKIFGYFSYDAYQLAFQFDLALGIFTALLGLLMVIRPAYILSFTAVLLGLFVLVDGVFKLQTASDARRFGLAHWWLILIGAIICILLGAFLIFDPLDGTGALMVVAGVALLTDGVQNLFNAFYTIRPRRTKSGH